MLEIRLDEVLAALEISMDRFAHDTQANAITPQAMRASARAHTGTCTTPANRHPSSLKREEKRLYSFIDLCILMGCDYLPSIKGIGPKTAYNLVCTITTAHRRQCCAVPCPLECAPLSRRFQRYPSRTITKWLHR